MKKIKWLDEYCNICGRQLNSWDKRCSNALKYKNALCENCIGKEYDMSIEELRGTMEHFFGLRPFMGI